MSFRFSRRFSLSVPLAALSLLLAACTGAPADDQNGGASSSSEATVPMSSSSSSQTAVMEKRYMDGTYSAVGSYRSPAGEETVNVSLTLTDGIITAAEFEGNGVNPRTQQMQGQFATGFEAEVVGKSIDELNLTVVNGSSLTPMGFMKAVEEIKAAAAVS